jgi:hypothetical protein
MRRYNDAMMQRYTRTACEGLTGGSSNKARYSGFYSHHSFDFVFGMRLIRLKERDAGGAGNCTKRYGG